MNPLNPVNPLNPLNPLNRLRLNSVSRLVVFDLDGTLIDSRLDLAESTNEMLESYGARALPVDTVAAMVGEGARLLVERALAASGLSPLEPDALDRFRAIYDRRLLIRTRPYDGIAAVVERASTRASLALLTNKPEPPTHRLLDAFGLARYFPRVIGGEAAFPRKPDPAAPPFSDDGGRHHAGHDVDGRRLDDRHRNRTARRDAGLRRDVRIREAAWRTCTPR